MRKSKFNYRNLTVLCAVLVIISLQSVANSIGASPLLAYASKDADINAESQILDGFVDDLGAFDKKHAELSKKASLTRVEFEAHQRTANDLKGRVSRIQSALQDIIRKLKAAGQWDNLDSIILAKTSDSRFQGFVRREGFKRILEAASTGLSADANEISNPLDLLRNKVKAQALDHSTLVLRAIPVAYNPAAAVFSASFKCRVGYLRLGFSKAFTGKVSEKATNQVNCSCFGECATQ